MNNKKFLFCFFVSLIVGKELKKLAKIHIQHDNRSIFLLKHVMNVRLIKYRHKNNLTLNQNYFQLKMNDVKKNLDLHNLKIMMNFYYTDKKHQK